MKFPLHIILLAKIRRTYAELLQEVLSVKQSLPSPSLTDSRPSRVGVGALEKALSADLASCQ